MGYRIVDEELPHKEAKRKSGRKVNSVRESYMKDLVSIASDKSIEVGTVCVILEGYGDGQKSAKAEGRNPWSSEKTLINRHDPLYPETAFFTAKTGWDGDVPVLQVCKIKHSKKMLKAV